jgi:hypothetical protein
MKNGAGGMQQSAIKYSIICPKCGKPAYRMEIIGDVKEYWHFTKNGSIKHVMEVHPHA